MKRLLLALLLCGCGAAPEVKPVTDDVARVLDDFHAAAAAADEARYFGHFADGAVFVGTDATERWSIPQFREYAHPHFSEGRGWTYVAETRHVDFDPTGQVAWFHEQLRNEKYGLVRGSGVLVRQDDAWRVAQYILSFPIPNDAAERVMKLVRETN